MEFNLTMGGCNHANEEWHVAQGYNERDEFYTMFRHRRSQAAPLPSITQNLHTMLDRHHCGESNGCAETCTVKPIPWGCKP